MGFRGSKARFAHISLIILLTSVASGLLTYEGTAQRTSGYFYRFTVDRKGSTIVEITFNSTATSGESWVFVPKFQSWNYTKTRGEIVYSENRPTDEVTDQSYYFYEAFKFRYQSTGLFSMTITFDFDNGALIMEPRGVFYSPQIGFEANSDGIAEVFFDNDFKVNQDPLRAIVVGSSTPYARDEVELNRVLFRLQENVVRLQVEFSVSAVAEVTRLRSNDNKTFTFETVSRYESYAINVLRLYDRIYNQTARLFNVTLEGVVIQWFLPDFDSLLSVGGFVPVFTGGLGEININIVFIRTVNGTVEEIATHELVHRFLGKAGIPPNEFLWFHEGMAQYISVNIVSDLGYEGAQTEKVDLESGTERLIQLLGGEDFGSIGLQLWSPIYQPAAVDVSSLYAASYYVISQLPQVVRRDGFEYYQSFFELIGQLPNIYDTAKIKRISELTLYLGQAVNASVASTLNSRWGFVVSDLWQLKDLIAETRRAVGGVNPIFQPYRALAGYTYQQAFLSAEADDWSGAESLLQLSITVANLAPLLTFLTIAVVLALLSYALTRRRRRPRLVVPPPPPGILQSSA